jgi:hypothetical protein
MTKYRVSNRADYDRAPVVCQNSVDCLCGPAVVVVQHPTKPFAALDTTNHGVRASPIVDQLVIDSLMVALDVVVLRVFLHSVAEMPLSQWDDLG